MSKIISNGIQKGSECEAIYHAVPTVCAIVLRSGYWIHAYHIGSKLTSMDKCISCWIQAVCIDCIYRVLQTERMVLGLVGTVVVIEEDLHTMDAPFFVFRLHTIYIIVHAIQIECSENMQLLCNMHAYYMHIGTCIDACVCPVPIGYMHITLEAS